MYLLTEKTVPLSSQPGADFNRIFPTVRRLPANKVILDLPVGPDLVQVFAPVYSGGVQGGPRLRVLKECGSLYVSLSPAGG